MSSEDVRSALKSAGELCRARAALLSVYLARKPLPSFDDLMPLAREVLPGADEHELRQLLQGVCQGTMRAADEAFVSELEWMATVLEETAQRDDPAAFIEIAIRSARDLAERQQQ